MRLYQRVLFGRPEPCHAFPLPPEIGLEDGGRLSPVHTPGHAADLVCYLQPERGWLFTGDLYIGTRPRYLREGESLALMLRSLRTVLGYEFSTVFCGHRGVVHKGYEAIREKLAYLEHFRAESRRLAGLGWSVGCITKKLLGREDLTSFATGFNFTKENLIRACLEPEDPLARRS
jgi:glyoxylase-like metal-dependent hydrolase (beta-lactamase superfamily II)